MANKMTKKDYFNAILAKYPLTDDEKAFVEKEIGLLEKKNASKKPTANQLLNKTYQTEILEFLSDGKAYTITEIMKGVTSLTDATNQKVSALVRGLIDAHLVERIEDKRKAYFKMK